MDKIKVEISSKILNFKSLKVTNFELNPKLQDIESYQF